MLTGSWLGPLGTSVLPRNPGAWAGLPGQPEAPADQWINCGEFATFTGAWAGPPAASVLSLGLGV